MELTKNFYDMVIFTSFVYQAGCILWNQLNPVDLGFWKSHQAASQVVQYKSDECMHFRVIDMA